jgi:hypothetical protein
VPALAAGAQLQAGVVAREHLGQVGLDVLQREELFVQLVVAALAVPDHAVHLVRQALALDHQADAAGRAPRRVRHLAGSRKISPARIGMSRTAPSSCTFSTISPSSW